MLALQFLGDLAKFLAAPDELPAVSGASVARGCPHPREIVMRSYFAQWSLLQLGIAGFAILILAASGLVANVRSVPDAYAKISDNGLLSGDPVGPELLVENELAEASRARLPGARSSITRQNPSSCRACGVVESVRPFGRSGFVDEQDTVDRRYLATGGGDATGGMNVPHALAGTGDAITVRFRDGTMKVFNEKVRGTWRPGNRLILIDGAVDTND